MDGRRDEDNSVATTLVAWELEEAKTWTAKGLSTLKSSISIL